MELYAIKTENIKVGDNLVEVVLESLKKQGLELQENDIIVFTSKILAYAEGRLVKLAEVKPSEKAQKLAQQFHIRPEFVELILREADKIYGGVERAILTLKNGILTANAGVDNKNAPDGYVALWPQDARGWAIRTREEIKQKTGKDVAVMIIDSSLTPLRKGTVGLALAVAGFNPIKDYRKERDIYGKSIIITQHAVADDLACAAHLLIGEADEKTPIALIRNAPVEFEDKSYGPEDIMMPFRECIFMNAFLRIAN
ncbi:MAG: coenzyme F420-0:L-glutamate ligase [Candidatus Bathyarchaeia archaeon]